jgi:sugar phosphate isomerase/epimerase
MDLFQFMDRAAGLGLDGVQLDITHLTSHDDGYLARIVRHAAVRNLYLEYGSTGIESERTARELEICRKLGAPLMRTYMGFSRFDRSTDVPTESAMAVRVLRELAPRAADYGIRIAVENHCDATAEELLRVIEAVDSPQVGICADLGNFMIHMEDPVASVRLLAPHIINTHFKDYALTMTNWGFKAHGVPLGEGAINLPAILEILSTQSRLDRIMLEVPVEPSDTEAVTLAREDDFISRSVRHAREVLKIQTP